MLLQVGVKGDPRCTGNLSTVWPGLAHKPLTKVCTATPCFAAACAKHTSNTSLHRSVADKPRSLTPGRPVHGAQLELLGGSPSLKRMSALCSIQRQDLWVACSFLRNSASGKVGRILEGWQGGARRSWRTFDMARGNHTATEETKLRKSQTPTADLSV